jgi:hypothetical protein
MSGTRRKSQRKQGGRRRKSQSKTRKAGSWPQFVKKTYLEMKKKKPSATFKEAMVEASARKKRGEF